MRSTLHRGIQLQWEDETARERTGHAPTSAAAKKMKSLSLYTHCCPIQGSSLRDWCYIYIYMHCQWEDETTREVTGHLLSYTYTPRSRNSNVLCMAHSNSKF